MVVVAVTHSEGQRWIEHLNSSPGVLVVSLSANRYIDSAGPAPLLAGHTDPHRRMFFAYPEVATARRRFPSSAASTSITSLFASYKPGLESELRDRLRALQAPVDCATARYLVIDDLGTKSGMGFSYGWGFLSSYVT